MTPAPWMAAVLANDEASSDAELVEYFIGNGVPEADARALVARRTEFLNGGVR